jgi:hypothetical protein
MPKKPRSSSPGNGKPKKNADIDSLLDEIQNNALRELSLQLPEVHQIAARSGVGSPVSDIAWVEQPVTFHEFVNDPWHMDQPPLGDRQRQDIETFLGEEPTQIFSRLASHLEGAFREAVLVWGKGGGKDWICTMVQCYLVYLLLCIKDPRHVLGLAPHEAVDILNVSYSAKQANEVYFTKFLQRILHWRWLRHNYPIEFQRKVINREDHPHAQLQPDGQNYVHIGADQVRFPHLIRAISEHSENESYEGYNILFWVMDEAAAFRNAGKKANAHKVYSTLRTSAVSRFPQLWRGMMISYPRSADDFIMTKYAQGQADSECFTSLAYTWQVNPTKQESDFEKDREKNPVEYEAKYRCNPPPRFGSAFDPLNVDACVDYSRKSLVKTKPAIISARVEEPGTGVVYQRQFVGKSLTDVNVHDLGEKARPRVFHVDGGLTNCPAGLVVAHGEPVMVQGQVLNKVVVDVLLQWKPLPSKRLQVSLNNIAAFIETLSHHITIVRGSYDQWNSQSALEALFLANIPVEKHDITADDYGCLEGLINLGCIAIPGDDETEWEIITAELKNLVRYNVGSRIRYDIPREEGETTRDDWGGPRYTKDIADCLAGVSRLLNDPLIRADVSGTRAPGLIAGPSMSSQGRGQPISARRDLANRGYLPEKLPASTFPTEAGFMGAQMNQSSRAANQHVLLTEIAGKMRLRGINEPTTRRPPKPIIK